MSIGKLLRAQTKLDNARNEEEGHVRKFKKNVKLLNHFLKQIPGAVIQNPKKSTAGQAKAIYNPNEHPLPTIQHESHEVRPETAPVLHTHKPNDGRASLPSFPPGSFSDHAHSVMSAAWPHSARIAPQGTHRWTRFAKPFNVFDMDSNNPSKLHAAGVSNRGKKIIGGSGDEEGKYNIINNMLHHETHGGLGANGHAHASVHGSEHGGAHAAHANALGSESEEAPTHRHVHGHHDVDVQAAQREAIPIPPVAHASNHAARGIAVNQAPLSRNVGLERMHNGGAAHAHTARPFTVPTKSLDNHDSDSYWSRLRNDMKTATEIKQRIAEQLGKVCQTHTREHALTMHERLLGGPKPAPSGYNYNNNEVAAARTNMMLRLARLEREELGLPAEVRKDMKPKNTLVGALPPPDATMDVFDASSKERERILRYQVVNK